MAITTVSDLNSLFNTIYEQALFVAREMNMMVPLVRNFSGEGFMTRNFSTRPQITAQSVSDGVDYANPTTFGKTSLANATPGEIIAQATLTDQDVETDPDNAVDDASLEMGGAIATKIDSDLVSTFGTFTTDAGAAGSALTIKRVAVAVSILRDVPIGNPLYCVLHPFGWFDIWNELGQPATNEFLGEVANEAMREFYVGQWLSLMWFVNANIATDASDDAISGVFNPRAIGFDTRRAPRLEPERDASLRATELNMTAGYGYTNIRTNYGIALTHDATTPSGDA